MSDGQQNPDNSNTASGAEVSADILGRALAHVEQLLQRLEYTPIQVLEESSGEAADSSAATAKGGGSAKRATTEASPATSSAAANVQPSLPTHTTTQAEALRITLGARDEANRMHAEAAASRAEAASEGERILVEAQQLATQLQLDARREIETMRLEAYRSAEALKGEMEAAAHAVQAAAAEGAAAVTADAQLQAEKVLAAAAEDADKVRADTAFWAQEQRRTVDIEVDHALTKAIDDAKEIRKQAEEQGRIEAAHQVDVAVRSAVAAAHSEAEAARARALELLGGAAHTVTQLRGTVGQVVTGLGATMEELNHSATQVESLLALTEGFDLPALPSPEQAVADALDGPGPVVTGTTGSDAEASTSGTTGSDAGQAAPEAAEAEGAPETEADGTTDAASTDTGTTDTGAGAVTTETTDTPATDTDAAAADSPSETDDAQQLDDVEVAGADGKPQRRPLGALFGQRS